MSISAGCISTYVWILRVWGIMGYVLEPTEAHF